MKKVLLFLCLTISYNALIAQKTTPVEKFKPPVVKTILGIRGDSSTVTTEEAKDLIRLPLKVSDAKNKTYSVQTYQFMYTRKAMQEDPETGKLYPVYFPVGQRFYKTPVSDSWVKGIQSQLQTDQKFQFFDIIVKDENGRSFYAPSLTIFIK